MRLKINPKNHSRFVARRTVASLELLKAQSAIEQFLYSCSHSLRAPLKSISGLVNLLRWRGDESLPAFDSNILLGSIDQSVFKMEALLNDMNNFLSHLQNQIEIEPVPIKGLISEVVDQLTREIVNAKLDVTTDIRQTSALYADTNRLSIVLTNVLSNALNFADDTKSSNKICIRVKISRSNVSIIIADNGIGISQVALPQVFNLFFRGSQKSKGAGVGLYVVKEMVTELGGDVTIKSTDGLGTVMLVSIPNLKP